MRTVDNCFKRVEQLAMVLTYTGLNPFNPPSYDHCVYFDLFNARVNL